MYCHEVRHRREEIEATEELQKHLHTSQEHCTFYSSAIKKSHKVLKYYPQEECCPNTPVYPCSKDIALHYTFDFAQQLQLPYHSRQVRPIYSKNPGCLVCVVILPYQVNYLVDEASTIGENGSLSHGANSVISMLHHFFDQHLLGENKLEFHASNCVGQNKNKSVVAYLCWRCIVGLHKEIVPSSLLDTLDAKSMAFSVW